MNTKYIGLIIAELFIIFIIVLIKIIFNKYEKKKVDKVLKYIDTKAKNNPIAENKIEKCIEIINNGGNKDE